MIRWLWHGPAVALSAVLVAGVRGYQYLIRPLLPPLCRFTPGCSEYFILAVRKYGPVKGGCQRRLADLPVQPVLRGRARSTLKRQRG